MEVELAVEVLAQNRRPAALLSRAVPLAHCFLAVLQVVTAALVVVGVVRLALVAPKAFCFPLVVPGACGQLWLCHRGS